ncbi:MAG: hypothetical protein RLZZ628_1106, partial [Bacteroidota bacterium]
MATTTIADKVKEIIVNKLGVDES